MPSRSRVLYVTDLTYQARGRRYCDEDIYLSSRLRASFDVALCHPLDAAALLDAVDLVVVRNSGPVVHYRAEYDAFRARAHSRGVPVYNELSGKADMAGKQYLVDLYAEGYPVIPTVDRLEDLQSLPGEGDLVVKPKWGADSVGLRFVPRDRVHAVGADDHLLQPAVDFVHEISFYFVDREFQYSLYAPRPGERWVLEPYPASEADLRFAQRFVDWNDIDHGIQRVDACRTPQGDLLLVELEDLNPYLSLDRLDPESREGVVGAVERSLRRLAG